ncbi:MAG: hypothetical protein NUV48_06895 [Peptococcaceae bacterium]|nr:hypothetical protein [Peptococcaceae bacterium]
MDLNELISTLKTLSKCGFSAHLLEGKFFVTMPSGKIEIMDAGQLSEIRQVHKSLGVDGMALEMAWQHKSKQDVLW